MGQGWRKWARAIGLTVWAACLAMPGAAASLTASELARAIPACGLLHLTDDGYAGLRGQGDRPEIVTRVSLRAFGASALRRSTPLGLRNSLPLQWGAASSIEAERSYHALAEAMRAAGFAPHEGYRWADISRLAAEAHRDAMARDGIGRCILFKWGNKQPDIFFQPLPVDELSRIRALFSDTSFARFRIAFAGRTWPHGLTDREAFELWALRLASFRFELNVRMLDRDRGGFSGNARGIIGGTVCTDEATIHEAFLRQVIFADGLMPSFALLSPAQFAQRRPQTRLTGVMGAILRRANNVYELTDHFAPVLVRKRAPLTLVLDSWVEDGGLPPHIATYDDWMDKREYRNLVPMMPEPGNAVDDILDRRARDGAGRVIRPHHGTSVYRSLRQALLARWFGGDLPVPRADPRSFGLTTDGFSWSNTAAWGR